MGSVKEVPSSSSSAEPAKNTDVCATTLISYPFLASYSLTTDAPIYRR